ncbi:MAG: hypothetical protein OXT72_04535 [Gammaproteobacteria bacterium]|nr:hypothetical protein [Gammaproteobacteria bacterium]MDE0247819.1 hypothetical protein [Gammaproteobacteria bacterium]
MAVCQLSSREEGIAEFGRLQGATSTDTNCGEHIWMVANGDALGDHPALARLGLPPPGIAGRPAAPVTATLLFIGHGSNVFGGVQPNM